VILKISDSEPLQVHFRSYLYSVYRMYTNICPDLCDPKTSRLDEACRVGRCSILHYCYYRKFTLLHSQDPATCPCSKPDNLVHAFPTDLFKIHFNLLQPTGHVMHHQFNIQQLYALPTLYLCVVYLSEEKQRLVPLTA
jgi:hypothetical protein